jgi:hypothetical protein
MGTWSLAGNALGTTPSGVLGTTDNNALVIETNGKKCLWIEPNGSVGLGTATPAATLDIAGGTLHVDEPASPTTITTAVQGAYLAWNALTGGTGETDFINNQGLGTGGFAFMNTPATGTPRTTLMVITGAGKVGIGTTAPTSTLQVNGAIAVQPSADGALGYLTVSGEYNNPQGTTGFNYYVNIGGGAPNSVLSVSAAAPAALGPIIALTNTSGGVNAAAALDFYTYDPGEGAGPDHATSPSSRIQAIDDGNFTNDIVFLINTPGAPNGKLVEKMRITSAGNITVPGDIVLTGADCAEQFDVSSPEPPEPGTVLVIDEEGALTESRDAYDKKVAGVVSGAGDYRHGILLDQRPGSSGRAPVAMVGKVYCKVDAEYASVDVGDLLTTSGTPGHAMKAADPSKAFGAVIGKALRPLAGGKALIPILIALQ